MISFKGVIVGAIIGTILCMTVLFKAAERDAKLVKDYKSGQVSTY